MHDLEEYCILKDRKLEIDRQLHYTSPVQKPLLRQELDLIDKRTFLYEGSYRTTWALKRVG